VSPAGKPCAGLTAWGLGARPCSSAVPRPRPVFLRRSFARFAGPNTWERARSSILADPMGRFSPWRLEGRLKRSRVQKDVANLTLHRPAILFDPDGAEGMTIELQFSSRRHSRSNPPKAMARDGSPRKDPGMLPAEQRGADGRGSNTGATSYDF